MMKLKQYHVIFGLVAGLAFWISTAATAAIILDDSGTFAVNSGVGSSLTLTSADLQNFNANGSDKLVVTANAERSGASGNGDVTAMTYGGVSLTKIEGSSSSIRNVSVWYLDDVIVSGDLVITFNNASGAGVSAVALSGTAAGFADSTLNGALNTTAGDFVIAAAINNNAGNPPTANAPMTQLFSADTGSSGGAAGYAEATGPTFTPSWGGATTEAYVGASFTVIPEPASLMLLATGGVFLLSRHRGWV